MLLFELGNAFLHLPNLVNRALDGINQFRVHLILIISVFFSRFALVVFLNILALRRCSGTSRSARMFTPPPTSAKRDVKIENASESSSFTTRYALKNNVQKCAKRKGSNGNGGMAE